MWNVRSFLSQLCWSEMFWPSKTQYHPCLYWLQMFLKTFYVFWLPCISFPSSKALWAWFTDKGTDANRWLHIKIIVKKSQTNWRDIQESISREAELKFAEVPGGEGTALPINQETYWIDKVRNWRRDEEYREGFWAVVAKIEVKYVQGIVKILWKL